MVVERDRRIFGVFSRFYRHSEQNALLCSKKTITCKIIFLNDACIAFGDFPGQNCLYWLRIWDYSPLAIYAIVAA